MTDPSTTIEAVAETIAQVVERERNGSYAESASIAVTVRR